MALPRYNATFSGTHNYGFQAGYIAGNVETRHYHAAEHPETPPHPSLSIPFPRDPDFVNRGLILDQLYDRRTAPASWTALVGLGGVGKSQLAIEYAYRIHEREPETWIFWVHAGNAVRFEQSYREIADTIKLFGRRDPRANIFKLVYDWLRGSENGKWILILDNVDNAHFLTNRPDKVQDQAGHENTRADRPLREYLPRSPNGSLLITSRSKEAALKLVDQRDIFIVDPMDEAHARELFEKKLGEQGTSGDIAELAATLEYMPLAIIQAAAYISDSDRDCSVRHYLNEFQKSDRKRIHLLEDRLENKEGLFRRDWEAKNSVLITWQISFDSIRQNQQSAANLLSLMSFFDRQGIPEALLRNYREEDPVETQSDEDSNSESQPSVADEFNVDILILRRYSLISINVDQKTLNMHNLVQLATRRWLEANGELEKWKQQYIRNLNAEFPTGEYENWVQCQVLFPHAKSAASQPPCERDTLLEWAAVLYKAAWYDWQKGSGAEGEKLSIKAMKTQAKYLGPEHGETLNSAEMVGLIYLRKGRWKEAEALFVQVMETRNRVLGIEHPSTLDSMANLASTYRNQGRWNEAEELFVQVMETSKRVLGVEHPDTLNSIANLAWTYGNQGRWNEAEELEVQVMETSKRVLGIEHPGTLDSMANLASTYWHQGRWNEAEELEVQVMETSKRVLGVEHPDTLTSMNNFAFTLKEQGRGAEALSFMKNCVQLESKVLGVDHPHTVSSSAVLIDWQTENLDIGV